MEKPLKRHQENSRLKIIATLPDAKYYKRIESPTSGRFLWEDKSSPAVRIMADFPNPFARPIVVVISQQRMKTDLSEYPYRVVFKCFESGNDTIPGIIVRERFKGVFAWSQSHADAENKLWFPLFFAIPINLDKKEWLGYSIYFDRGSGSS